jgi:hypothetical protein
MFSCGSDPARKADQVSLMEFIATGFSPIDCANKPIYLDEYLS